MRNYKTPIQKRVFELIAATIAQIEDDKTRAQIALLFVQSLKPTNPRFDAYRFRTACKVPA